MPRLGRSVTYKFKDCIDKVDESGVAFCSWCKDKICYGSEGKKAFTKHFNRAKHVKEFLIRATNYQLSASLNQSMTIPLWIIDVSSLLVLRVKSAADW